MRTPCFHPSRSTRSVRRIAEYETARNGGNTARRKRRHLQSRTEQSAVGSISLAAGLVATFGLIQYATKQLFIDRIHIPGLTGVVTEGLIVRNGFARPSGTSTHPIEYGVVLTMFLPRGYHICAQVTQPKVDVSRISLCHHFRNIPLDLPLSDSLCNSRRARPFHLMDEYRAPAALAFISVIGTVVYITVPGMLGAVTGLFTGVAEDPSIASRTGSYDIAAHFIANSPLLGRGFGTFLPKYWILDNGYLGMMIEGGALGIAGLVVLIVTAIFAAKRARTMTVSQFDRDIAQAIIASIVAGATPPFLTPLAFRNPPAASFCCSGWPEHCAGSFWHRPPPPPPNRNLSRAAEAAAEFPRRSVRRDFTVGLLQLNQMRQSSRKLGVHHDDPTSTGSDAQALVPRIGRCRDNRRIHGSHHQSSRRILGTIQHRAARSNF